jgi:hypothetical protein
VRRRLDEFSVSFPFGSFFFISRRLYLYGLGPQAEPKEERKLPRLVFVLVDRWIQRTSVALAGAQRTSRAHKDSSQFWAFHLGRRLGERGSDVGSALGPPDCGVLRPRRIPSPNRTSVERPRILIPPGSSSSSLFSLWPRRATNRTSRILRGRLATFRLPMLIATDLQKGSCGVTAL